MEVKAHKLFFIVSWKWRLLFQEKWYRMFTEVYIHSLSMDSLLWHWICWNQFIFFDYFILSSTCLRWERVKLNALILLSLMKCFVQGVKFFWEFVETVLGERILNKKLKLVMVKSDSWRRKIVNSFLWETRKFWDGEKSYLRLFDEKGWSLHFRRAFVVVLRVIIVESLEK